jgi:predicted ester cyclase
VNDDAKATYRRAIRALAARDRNVLTSVLADDVVDHNPIPGQSPGSGGFVEFMDALHAGLQDIAVDVELLLGEDPFVAARIVWSGLHVGMLVGIPGSGRRVSIPALHIVRVVNGRVTEWWGHADVSELTSG